MRRVLRVIDAVSETVGSVSSWLVIAMVIVILWEVVSRYVFNAPTTWAFDGMRLIGGAIIVIGWAYAQLHNEHIRVDIFYTRFSARKKAVVDIVGSVLFFFPLLGVVTYIVVMRELELLLTGRILTFSFWMFPASLYGVVIMLGLCLTSFQFVAQLVRDIYMAAKGNQYD